MKIKKEIISKFFFVLHGTVYVAVVRSQPNKYANFLANVKPLKKTYFELIMFKQIKSQLNHHENCYQPENDKVWCRECVPSCIIEGWTSENSEIDEFIKDTIYNAKERSDDDDFGHYPLFLEWVPFDRFEDIKQIGEGGFAKVYSAKWIDGQAEYEKQDDGSWKKLEPESKIVALKGLNGSQSISADYLNEVYLILFHFNYNTIS